MTIQHATTDDESDPVIGASLRGGVEDVLWIDYYLFC